MLNGRDLLVLFHLLVAGEEWSYRSVGSKLDLDPAVVHRAVARLTQANLVREDRSVDRAVAEEFLVHAAKFFFPGRLGAPSRGVATAWGAGPLSELVAESRESPPVWPSAHGSSRGPAVEPIVSDAVERSERDPELGEWLSLVDAIRVGGARDRGLAAAELSARIWGER